MTPSAQRFLASLAAAGVRRVPRRAASRTGGVASGAGRGAEHGAEHATGRGPGRGTGRSAEEELAAVAAEVAVCRACRLHEGRTHAVPGEGDPHADVVFVGEGPGADEDRTGRPFVGRAGQLLDRIITSGMKRRRQDVFICNVVKCRPPGNRVPAPDEVAACEPFLARQLAALRPKVICALGATAARVLLRDERPMSRLRGRVHEHAGIPVIATYHPAYLLRNPAAKADTWEDIQKVMAQADRA